MAAALFQRMTGGREGCLFDTSAPKVDASFVCHELRCLELAQGEKACISVRDMSKREGEVFASLGEVCHLKSLNLDTMLLFQVWATSSEVSMIEYVDRRPCGEMRIPVYRLVSRCNGILYHTWMTLDNPGLRDSVASLGSAMAVGDDAEAFDQALFNGPRQLFQPKACISICKTAELGASGKVLWQEDSPNEQRITQWGALLRSQQQHIVMSTAQHLQSAQASGIARTDEIASLKEQLDDAESSREAACSRLRGEVQELEATGRSQTQEISRLKDQLQDAESSREAACSRLRAEVQDLEARGQHALREETARATATAGADSEALRGSLRQKQQEFDDLQTELTKISEEANKKIDAANERIRALRKDRDEFQREVEQLKLDKKQMAEALEADELDKRALVEQKEALMKIVEDLHQTCATAGLMQAGRTSIDSITKFNFT